MSPAPIIQLTHLSKKFGNLQAIADLNLEVYEGDVFGFLGPNGAGKSTTIRMLLTLIQPSSGDVYIFGKKVSEHRNDILRRIGCIIEKPDLYSYLSAAKNLELLGRLSGIRPSKQKIYETLELVGLKGRERDKVKTYSHGMKQRLGIAQTLIHDPTLIILDEPTTGLDPQGIIDVRNLIRHLQRDLRKTIFLSSHILSEIELIASRMAIINKGVTVAQGSVSELLSSQDLIVSVEVDNTEKAVQVIQTSGWQKKFRQSYNHHLDFALSKKEIPELVAAMENSGIQIFAINYKRTLEDYFLKLTAEHQGRKN